MIKLSDHNPLNLLFPYKCPLCGSIIKREQYDKGMCDSCYKRIEKATDRSQKIDDAPFTDSIYCTLFYSGSVKDAIIRYKFNGNLWMSKPFGYLMYNSLKNMKAFDGCDMITYVPISHKRFAERGFNQSERLARVIDKKAGIGIIPTLSRYESDMQTSKLGRDERLKSAKGRFFCSLKEKLEEKTILLIDDILTTGSTVNECSRILKENGAREVRAAVLASGRTEMRADEDQ